MRFILNCSQQEIEQMHKDSAENRKSLSLWEHFQASVSLVHDSHYNAVLKDVPSRTFSYITLIRSLCSNRIVAFGESLERCLFSSCEPVKPETTLYDSCLLNAYKAYFPSIQILNPGKKSALSQSMPQLMGIVSHDGNLYVYVNVLVDDSVFDLIDIGDAVLPKGYSLVPIPDFRPLHGSLEEHILDSLVCTGG